MGFPFVLFRLARCRFQLAFADAVGSPLEEGDVGVMGQAVEESGNGGGIGKDGVPLFEGLIGGQQNRIALVTVVDDFEEQVGGMGVVGQIAAFVDDQQGGASVVAEAPAAQGGGIPVEVGEQAGGGAEQDGVAREHGRVGNVLGNHGLSEPIRASHIVRTFWRPPPFTIVGILFLVSLSVLLSG